jgi:hypothetical protein
MIHFGGGVLSVYQSQVTKFIHFFAPIKNNKEEDTNKN